MFFTYFFDKENEMIFCRILLNGASKVKMNGIKDELGLEYDSNDYFAPKTVGLYLGITKSQKTNGF